MPFSVYAADGRLLLPAHAPLADVRVQAKLGRQQALFVQRADHDAWRRGLARAVDKVMQSNASLSQLAQARPDPVPPVQAPLPGEEWEHVVLALDRAVQAARRDVGWVRAVQDVQAQMRAMVCRRVDEALFYFIHTGSRRTALYSSRQALRCMLIAGEAARELGWSEERIAVLDKAALTMNVASWQLQDELVCHVGPIVDEQQRAKIDRHPAEGAWWLRHSGVTDPAWLEAVQLHHDDSLAARAPSSLTPGQEMAHLLRRVDRYSAMLSRRAGREALSATQAAQQACLGTDGKPDPTGSLMLKAVGLYPPGCFVRLASRETGIVLARGERANAPVVAALLNAEGASMAEPRLRFTTQAKHAVCTAVSPGLVHVDPPLDRMQALHVYLKSNGPAA
ncbi:HD-GYP domain-containing protein [Azohydromonas lata]|uniref:HD-GYP domain-containing protein n=1 Tax=Azohydromonas lata TaxID=45677 RepID=UPI0008349E1F|nr:hypothetical protein [Azohydromonas lata]